MNMSEPTESTWRFAPTGGGAEQGISPGQQYFVNDAVTKTVRELLQNCIDHPVEGIETVEVKFQLVQANPDDIGAGALKEHIESSLAEVTKDRDTDAVERYKQMLSMLNKPAIPCLAIIDNGTTGLQQDNWRNLIFREGTPTAAEGQTKGGSFGFGKNAPFNLSTCNTVIYSTRYVSIPAKGRVEHLAGRSQLVSHDDTRHPDVRLQQTGFLAIHPPEGRPNQPLEGTSIPTLFRLTQQGTGVFIVGFDTDVYHDWAEETAKAAVTQFFYAIHTHKMAVTIQPSPESEPRVINHDTLGIELEDYPKEDPTRFYYQVLVDNESVLTNPSGRLEQMGQLRCWISTAKDAPRRTAHINRRGMLITDTRTISDNPFYPHGGRGWPHWCAVTMAHDEKADAFIRRMEPPAHDAIHYRQLRDRNRQRIAGQELREQREQITALIKARIDQALTAASSNVNELADLFADMPDLSQGVHKLNWREQRLTERGNDIVDVVDDSDEREHGQDDDGDSEMETDRRASGESQVDGEGDGQGDGGEGDGEGDAEGNGQGNGANNFDEPERRKASPKPSDNAIRHARLIRANPRELVMTFTTPSTKVESLTFGIKTAGEQYQKHEDTVRITDVKQTSNLLITAKVEDNAIVVSGPPDTPVTLRLALESEDAPYQSYSISQIQKQATTA